MRGGDEAHPGRGFSAEELALRAGTTREQVERFVELGILERGPGDAPFAGRHIHRVRFAAALDAAGISLDDLARLVKAGEYSFTFIEDTFPGEGWPLLATTFAELAAGNDLTWEAVRQMYTNWGLATPEEAQRAREDDELALRGRAAVREFAGLDEEGLVASSRFLGENIRRLAVSQVTGTSRRSSSRRPSRRWKRSSPRPASRRSARPGAPRSPSSTSAATRA